MRSDLDIELDPAQAAGGARARTRPSVTAAGRRSWRRYERDELPGKLDGVAEGAEEGRALSPWAVVEPAEQQVGRRRDASRSSPTARCWPAARTPTTTPTPSSSQTKAEGRSAPSGWRRWRTRRMVKGGPGRAANGNFALSDFEVTAAPLAGRQGGRGEARQGAGDVRAARPAGRGDHRRRRAVGAGRSIRSSARTTPPSSSWPTPIGHEGGTMLTFTLTFNNNTGHNIGRPRLSLSDAARRRRSSAGDGVPADVQRGAGAARRRQGARRSRAGGPAAAGTAARTPAGGSSTSGSDAAADEGAGRRRSSRR